MIDYEGLEKSALEFEPHLLICGASAYPRDFDYARLRAIADSVHALLMADMAHTAGLIASGLLASPFAYCDVVTTTTHKSLRGPRAAMIFFRRKYEEQINFAVFPQLQGGPHNTNIAGIAVQMKEVASEGFKEYSRQVVANSKAMCECMMKRGEKFITGGTDNHLVMWDVRVHELTGSKVEKVLDKMHITTNKNALVGDKSYVNPGGIRLGTPAITTRGMKEKDMEVIVDFLMKGIEIAKRIQDKVGKQLKDFIPAIEEDQEI